MFPQINKNILKGIFSLTSANSANFLITALVSILIFRTVDKDHYGLYIFLMSGYALFELFLSGINETINRYLSEDKNSNINIQLIKFFYLVKICTITLFCLFFFLLNAYGLFEVYINDFYYVAELIVPIFYIITLNALISSFTGITNSFFNSQGLYKYIASVNLYRSIVYLIVVFILTLMTNNYLIFLVANTVISFFYLIFLHIQQTRKFPKLALKKIIKTRIDLKDLKSIVIDYTAPLSFQSMLSYSKNHIPILILGSTNSLEGTAIFSILKNLLKSLHGISGSFFDPMLSSFNKLKRDSSEFKKNIRGIFYYSLVLRVLAGFLIYIFWEVLFNLFNIEDNKLHFTVLVLLTLEYTIAGLSQSYGLIIKLGDSTKDLLKSSLLRFVFELTLIIIFLQKYGIIAAALILVFARYVETVALYYFSNKEYKMHNLILIIIIFLIVFSISHKLIY